MTDPGRPTGVRTGAAAREEAPGRTGSLTSLVTRFWPTDLPKGRCAGLPTCVADVLRPGRTARRLRRVAEELDRALPGWPEVAARAVAGAADEDPDEERQRLCLLLARRHLRAPEPLLKRLRQLGESPTARLWLLVALSGTDTAAVRAGWREELTRVSQSRALTGSCSAWFAFARAMLGGWLSWPDFREWFMAGRAVVGAGPEYRRSLARIGLWEMPLFAKWYRQAVYELAHQPDVSLSFEASGWMLDFPGTDYLRDALASLERDPTSWWPLHVLRWASDVDVHDEALGERLRASRLPSLCLLSLLRPDLAGVIGQALGVPQHEAAIGWLLGPGPARPPNAVWLETVLRPWTARLGEALAAVLKALQAVYVPPDFDPELDPDGCTEAYLAGYLIPAYRQLMDRHLYVLAIRQQRLPRILAAAREGRTAAAHALALWPEQAEHAVPVLFALTRDGRRAVRQSAQEALGQLAARLGVPDLVRLEKRVDLAAAWPDLGMEGRAARAWWDVGGHHVRLSVARGEVKLEVYSGARKLASAPPDLRQAPQWAEIRHCREELATCYRYFRRRFEQAMVEGVSYRGSDFAALLGNPVVRSLAARLVLLVDGQGWRWAPDDAVHECEVPTNITEARGVAIAHPVELHHRGTLAQWQQHAIEQRVPQPFKQVFREVYLVGEGERTVARCDRFAGCPMVARQAFALLHRRGYAPGKGDATKEWPTLGLRAHLLWATPDQPAGKLVAQGPSAAPVTSGAIWFEELGGGPVVLEEVPPVLFSETMRDADLMVSLAAFGEGGFSSEETRRLRASLVRHVARALGLATVYVSDDETHVIVDGTRAVYRVHLGSGSVLLEESRRHLDLGRLATPVEFSLMESADSLTARIVGTIVALSHDDRIIEPEFLAQVE